MSRARFAALVSATMLASALAGVATSSAATPPTQVSPSSHNPTVSALFGHGLTPALRAIAAADHAKATASQGAAPRAVAHLDPATAELPTVGAGLVRVQVSGSGAASAVTKLGGRVLVSNGNLSSAFVPKADLAQLAQSAGVTQVSSPEKAFVEASGPSEGPSASGEAAWNTAGFHGDSTSIAIVDAGFGTTSTEYNDEVAAGHLGTTPIVANDGCTNGSISTPYDGVAHGLETAELAHQMAPSAQLYLYCVADSVGFNSAASNIITNRIPVASSSLGFPNDARGDGTGAAGSAALAVKTARKAGVLWIQSAGNQGYDHWGQSMSDTDHDGIVDLGGPFNRANNQFEEDLVFVAPGTVSAPSAADIFLQWDRWPVTNDNVILALYGHECTSNLCATSDTINGTGVNGSTISVSHQNGTAPTLEADTSAHGETGVYGQVWEVVIFVGSGTPASHLDLNYYGQFAGPSALDCPTATNNICNIPAQAYSDSLSSPANSPYAMAVGAADVGTDGTPRGTLEPFSSQGPTIDGRTKPDITGWDGLTSYLPEFSGGFYGTSAAAPVVAGAAATVAASNPSLDASQIEAFLEQRAGYGSPHNPPTNAMGHGLLTMGAAPTLGVGALPPAGARYTAITPTRVLDTRASRPPLGFHKGALGGGGTVTFGFPSGLLPGDATAVVINLTGVNATGPTYLSAYAGGTAFPGTSNLNLAPTDTTAAVLAPVTLGSGQTITIRNNAYQSDVVVDVLGYFGTGAETGLFTPLPVVKSPRVLDTRTSVGGHLGKLPTNGTITVDPAAPTGTTAVVVNLTAVNTAAPGGFFNLSPMCSTSSSTLNVTKYTRANMAIVGLDPSGHFCLSSVSGASDVIVDVLGFFGSTGSQYYALPAPARILDTRTGNNGQLNGTIQSIGNNAAQQVFAPGIGEIPYLANGLFTDVVEANSTTGGYLLAYAGLTRPSTPASTVNFTTGRIVSNAAIVGALDGQFGLYNNAGNTNAAVDVFGYFLPPSG